MSRGPEKKFDPDIALARAMEVFWERGYEAASLSELQTRMGIGRKSLYDTFGNKRALFLKALAYYSQTVVGSLRDRLEASGSPLANLQAVLEQMQCTHALPGSKGCMLGTNIADFNTDDEEVAALLRGYLAQVEFIYAKTIERAQSAGELERAIAPQDLARMLLCLTQGMALLGRVMEEDKLLAGAVSAMSQLLEGR